MATNQLKQTRYGPISDDPGAVMIGSRNFDYALFPCDTLEKVFILSGLELEALSRNSGSVVEFMKSFQQPAQTYITPAFFR